MAPVFVVGNEVGVLVPLVFLHFFDGLVLLGPARNAEVLFKKRVMQALDEPVGLRHANLARAVLVPIQPQEKLVGMVVLEPTEFAAVVGQHGLYGHAMALKVRQHVFVHHMDRCDRQLAGVEPAKGVQAEVLQNHLICIDCFGPF